ncbi:MAG: hypothetical protein H7126_08760 [Candidatus Parcubacteria bacterium]|nr:hypothetical protein [Leptolyngbyaceae cyanobacterium LF-bin-113]
MAENLTFPNEKLPPIADLNAIAEVTQKDIDQVAQIWKNKPPDEDFKLILEAGEK